MDFKNNKGQLFAIINHHLAKENSEWLSNKIDVIVKDKSARELYLCYSILGTKINTVKTNFLNSLKDDSLKSYLEAKKANLLEISRIYLLIAVLEADEAFFAEKVKNIIQVADTGEIETFLKFLILLPNPENYKFAAVEALRTNIPTVFDAITLNNPYPAKYFNNQQWNQMYLKAAFMERNLLDILGVEERANKDLTRIISDYAHERWAASRTIDPFFWRPVSNFIEGVLLDDMKHLFQSDNFAENKAAALCCALSDKKEAKDLLVQYQELKNQVESKKITWQNIKK